MFLALNERACQLELCVAKEAREHGNSGGTGQEGRDSPDMKNFGRFRMEAVQPGFPAGMTQ